MSAHASAGTIATGTARRQLVAVEDEFDIVYNAVFRVDVAASELHINHLPKKLPSAEEGFFLFLPLSLYITFFAENAIGVAFVFNQRRID